MRVETSGPRGKIELPHHEPRGYGRDEVRRKLLVFSWSRIEEGDVRHMVGKKCAPNSTNRDKFSIGKFWTPPQQVPHWQPRKNTPPRLCKGDVTNTLEISLWTRVER